MRVATVDTGLLPGSSSALQKTAVTVDNVEEYAVSGHMYIHRIVFLNHASLAFENIA